MIDRQLLLNYLFVSLEAELNERPQNSTLLGSSLRFTSAIQGHNYKIVKRMNSSYAPELWKPRFVLNPAMGISQNGNRLFQSFHSTDLLALVINQDYPLPNSFNIERCCGSWDFQQVFGAQMASTYHTSFLPVAETWDFILESGALYLCGGIAFISLGFGGPFTYDVLVGIAPTIIAVRVALGQSVENMDSFFVPRSRVRSSVHHEVIATAVDLVHDEVLYIRPESIKVEAV
ncbi:hypothetical protein B0H13DRAFT_1886382 [Mycena leptocephala]|nr:hypothetical protein B0H13DRAFT_1886382 [Mycena leptocephala]